MKRFISLCLRSLIVSAFLALTVPALCAGGATPVIDKPAVSAPVTVTDNGIMNNFLCFKDYDLTGQKFQAIFDSPSGRQSRIEIDNKVTELFPKLLQLQSSINREDLQGCTTKFRSCVDEETASMDNSDSLAKSIVAAKACTLWVAILTEYDHDEVGNWGKLSHEDKYMLSSPETVLRRGKAVCGGFAKLNRYFALALADEYGFQCLKTDGYSRSTAGTSVDSSGTVDHSWVTYFFKDGLWAPSDPTVTSYALRKHGTSFGAPLNFTVIVDPRLRDAFHLLRYAQNYESNEDDQVYIKSSQAPHCTIFDLNTWNQLVQTHYQDCLDAKKLANSERPN